MSKTLLTVFRFKRLFSYTIKFIIKIYKVETISLEPSVGVHQGSNLKSVGSLSHKYLNLASMREERKK